MEANFQPITVGYAWYFENIVFYDPEGSRNVISFLRHSKRKNVGQFVGVVKQLIPNDPYCMLYMRLHHTEAFKQRQHEARILTRLGLTRKKMKFMKLHGQQKLAVKVRK